MNMPQILNSLPYSGTFFGDIPISMENFNFPATEWEEDDIFPILLKSTHGKSIEKSTRFFGVMNL